MPVEVLAGAVVSHGGAGVGVACCDLDVAQVDPGVKHRGHERVPEHVQVGVAYRHGAKLGQMTKTTGGGMPVHPGLAGVEQDRPRGPAADSAVDGTADGRRQAAAG